MKITLLILFAGAMLGLSACRAAQPAYSPPPVLANATDVARGTTPQGLEIISFRTSDSPDAVLSQYQKVLTAAGWVLDEAYPESAKYRFPNGFLAPSYGLYVQANRTPSGQTQVLLNQVELDRLGREK
jgi:hypothetical protein